MFVCKYVFLSVYGVCVCVCVYICMYLCVFLSVDGVCVSVFSMCVFV